ncbi:hypothetical protein HDU82_002583 [Entophlyctis luteolus]|nr:hypothetical protein HDU82_002583 [Entophlyctis luteolus]KAJ3390343.1 hypothetical protein HDU84_007598 [Entophlyctis sp. JEL0112]
MATASVEETAPMSRPNVLVACTGSVASIKVPLLVRALHGGCNVRVVATDHAVHFFDPVELRDAAIPVLCDSDEWAAWSKRSDPVLHIDLRNWAHLIVVAPLDANTLAKIANGLCDNLLTCVLRAWDFSKPVLVAPAMNTHMWNHPFTNKHLKVAQEDLGYTVISPIKKQLACGDIGIGAMAEVDEIVRIVMDSLRRANLLPTGE